MLPEKKIMGPPVTAAADYILRLSFNLPEALGYIAHLRRTARTFSEGMGMRAEDADDLELLLGELATNAVRHAQGGAYTVEVVFYTDRAVVTVTDTGVGFSAENLLPPGAVRPDGLDAGASERIGGYGLPLVYSIADHVDIRPNDPQGTTVRAEKVFR